MLNAVNNVQMNKNKRQMMISLDSAFCSLFLDETKNKWSVCQLLVVLASLQSTGTSEIRGKNTNQISIYYNQKKIEPGGAGHWDGCSWPSVAWGRQLLWAHRLGDGRFSFVARRRRLLGARTRWSSRARARSCRGWW
jgi:hypothetical protein